MLFVKQTELEPETIVATENQIVFAVVIYSVHNSRVSVFLKINKITVNGTRKFCVTETDKNASENDIVLHTQCMFLKLHPTQPDINILDNNKIGPVLNINLESVSCDIARFLNSPNKNTTQSITSI